MRVIAGILLSARKKSLDPTNMFCNMWTSWNLNGNVSVYLHELNYILCPGQGMIFPLSNHNTMSFAAFKFHLLLQIHIKFSKDLGNQEACCDYFDSTKSTNCLWTWAVILDLLLKTHMQFNLEGN